MFDIYNHLAVFGILWVFWQVVALADTNLGGLQQLLYPLIATGFCMLFGEVLVWSVMYLLGELS